MLRGNAAMLRCRMPQGHSVAVALDVDAGSL